MLTVVTVGRMFVCEDTGKVMAHCVMLPEDEQGSAIMTMVAGQSSDASADPMFPTTCDNRVVGADGLVVSLEPAAG
jgi:hypothetical protein